MGQNSGISWTDSTWNPVTGCSKLSEACRNCYAETISLRFGWTAKPWAERYAAENVRLHRERLQQPLRWRSARRIFVCSMADLFHEQVPDDFLIDVFGIMALAEWHTFQVLTKRTRRMHDFFRDYGAPPENVWCGTSVENQKRADERVPLLLQIPASVRFLSIEPLLGPVDLSRTILSGGSLCHPLKVIEGIYPLSGFVGPVQWVIVGGESGPGAARRKLVYRTADGWRPHPHALNWVRSLRDQCAKSDTAFWFKQWGGPTYRSGGDLLDGLTWHQFPEPTREAVAVC